MTQFSSIGIFPRVFFSLFSMPQLFPRGPQQVCARECLSVEFFSLDFVSHQYSRLVGVMYKYCNLLC